LKNSKVKYLTKVGVLAAIAAVLQLIEFPLPFLAPGFYKMDLSDVPALVGGFALGPLAGALIELLKNLLHIVIKGTSTAYVGEFANFVTGCALVLPAAIMYRYKKNFKGAVLGMTIGAVCLVVVGALLNYYVLIPTYSELYKLPLDIIINMGTKVNSNIVDLKSLVVLAVMPFNLVKSAAVFVLTMLLYKRVSRILHI
jgi:riboflavin transporter FmnP